MSRFNLITAMAAAVTALLSVPTTTLAYDGGSYGGGSYGGDDCAGGTSTGYHTNRTLQVVGLTKQNQLVCFNEFRPGDARTINFVSNCQVPPGYKPASRTDWAFWPANF